MRAAPENNSSSPESATGSSSGCSPPNGLWKLSLDKEPPAGAKLVLFLPVCQTQTNGLTIPPEASPTLPRPATQIQPPCRAAVGAMPNTHLDLVGGIRQDPEFEAPLDLSKKRYSPKPALTDIRLPPIKSEAEEAEISEEAYSTKKQEYNKNSINEVIGKANPRGTDTDTEVKKFEIDPINLSLHNTDATSSGLKIDIKNEPQSPGLDFDSWPSGSCHPTEIKMEVDVLNSAHANTEK